MRKITTIGFVGAAAAVLGTTAIAAAGSPFQTGPMGFTPLPETAASTATPDPDGPFAVPTGYTQHLVSGETADRCGGDGLNIYGDGLDDWEDMNTVNETGRQAGRYLYRTHEVRLNSVPDATYPAGGAVSVVDLETCEARVIAQREDWTALDGIVWTPWGTILFAEETTGGRLFELVLDKKDPMSGTIYERPAVGQMAHEGIEVGTDGSVYVIDEQRGQTSSDGGGGIYRFVPDTYGDLSSGSLYTLAVDDGDGDGKIGENVGQGSWVGPIDPTDVRAETEASYQRPEDLERIGDVLYVAITEGTRPNGGEAYDGRILAVNLDSLEVTDYVKPGVLAPVEIGVPGAAGFQTGFDNPDNLAHGPDGKLWIVEDNVPSDIWVAVGSDPMHADSIGLFATLTDVGAEGTGIYFGKDPKTLFVNVQHSIYDDGDGTWAITNR